MKTKDIEIVIQAMNNPSAYSNLTRLQKQIKGSLEIYQGREEFDPTSPHSLWKAIECLEQAEYEIYDRA